MKKTTLILRSTVLYVLALVAMYCIFCEPLDESGNWYTDLFVSKAIGLSAAYSVYLLPTRWTSNISSRQKR